MAQHAAQHAAPPDPRRQLVALAAAVAGLAAALVPGSHGPVVAETLRSWLGR